MGGHLPISQPVQQSVPHIPRMTLCRSLLSFVVSLSLSLYDQWRARKVCGCEGAGCLAATDGVPCVFRVVLGMESTFLIAGALSAVSCFYPMIVYLRQLHNLYLFIYRTRCLCPVAGPLLLSQYV